MKNTLLCLLLFALPFVSFGQKALPRQLLQGRIVADSLKTDNLSVSNITSRIGAVTDENGYFTMYVRATDTLIFSSVTFRTSQLVIKEDDLLADPLIIRLDANVIVLDEVVIRPSVLTGVLDKDSKKVKTLKVTADMQSAKELNRYSLYPVKYNERVNGGLPPNMAQMNGINFTRIYDMYFRKRKKKQDRGEIYSADATKSFTEVVKERFTYYFFTQTLSIPKDEIGLFLNFCDGGEATKPLLDPKKDFELTDYLVQKSKDYLAKKQ